MCDQLPENIIYQINSEFPSHSLTDLTCSCLCSAEARVPKRPAQEVQEGVERRGRASLEPAVQRLPQHLLTRLLVSQKDACYDIEIRQLKQATFMVDH